jgi:hypothetical protein
MPGTEMSDLKTRARVFLDFAIDSVVEGFSDPECYSEADHAIACLDRIFEREASEDVLRIQLIMMGLLETKFARIYMTSRPSERDALLRESLDRLRFARTKFD